ncbi:MAG: GNAT family N-acetyltransferase, partial [Alphaproteobacteria bacterium]|nr:GNAT family N-acetyltransferase [Alphaproteobacteria bacterium]
RTLGPEDVAILGRVQAGVFDHPIRPDQAAAFFANDLNVMVAAESGGRIVGMCSGHVMRHPDKAPAFFVNEISVHSGFRRRGIGTRLMQAILDAARRRGCEGIWLGTEKGNEAARGLYRSMGARETPGLVLYDWDDAEL